MWKRGTTSRLLFLTLILTFYIFSVVHNLSESERRSLDLRGNATASDQVNVSIRIVEADLNASEITARLSFTLTGRIAKDAITPAGNLRVLLNSVGGPQTFDFPRGERLNPILAIFSLDGNVNRYPLDRHQANIKIIVTTPSRAPLSAPKRSLKESGPVAWPEELHVGLPDLQNNEQIPLSLKVSASIPGLKFGGTIEETGSAKINQIQLLVRRSDSVIVVSFLNMLLMMALAISVLSMTVRATAQDRELNLLPLSLCMTLIFGLPALRNTQPGVPPLGAISDFISFIWAENSVAISAIILMWTWINRSRHTNG